MMDADEKNENKVLIENHAPSDRLLTSWICSVGERSFTVLREEVGLGVRDLELDLDGVEVFD